MLDSPLLNLEHPDAAGKPVYHRIADAIRRSVREGRLGEGERVPPIRALAGELGVNRDTVSLAYDLLSREGLLEATVGRGTFVSATMPEPSAAPVAPPRLSSVVERLLDFERARPGFGGADGAVALHSLVPDPSLYPVQEFRRALNRALAAGGSKLLVYGGHQGSQRLRELIAARLQGHGLDVDAGNVVVCQGASQGTALAVQLYAQAGDWVAVEEPTYHNVLGMLVGLGLRATPVPMTPDGPELQALERTLARPEVKLFYTMPSFHNPMGTTTSIAHRRRVLDIAQRAGKPIIEDAFEMDLRYDGKPVSALAGLDRHGLVVHLFSFSKSLFPGVRLGAVTGQGRAVDGLLALKYTNDLSGAMVLQAAVADFVDSGGYERHLKSLRRTLRRRRDVLLESLERHMPRDAWWTRPEGGYQVWLELPSSVDTRLLLSEAQRDGVMFAPGYHFNHDGRPSSGMRLTTALANEEEIPRGVALLGDRVARHLRSATRSRRELAVHV